MLSATMLRGASACCCDSMSASRRDAGPVFATITNACSSMLGGVGFGKTSSLGNGAHFAASLVLIFAALSLVLAGVGLYGVLSYVVTQRVPEIGIRIALGAQWKEVLQAALGRAFKLLAYGSAAGYTDDLADDNSAAGSANCRRSPDGCCSTPVADDTSSAGGDRDFPISPIRCDCNRRGSTPNSIPIRPIPKVGY